MRTLIDLTLGLFRAKTVLLCVDVPEFIPFNGNGYNVSKHVSGPIAMSNDQVCRPPQPTPRCSPSVHQIEELVRLPLELDAAIAASTDIQSLELESTTI